ncbi:MAG: hypothetical protein ACRCZI_10855 [Cetobacterium sp.]
MFLLKKLIFTFILCSSFLKAEWKMGTEVDKFGDAINKMCYVNEGQHVIYFPTKGYKDVEDMLIEISRSNYMKVAIEKEDSYIDILEFNNKGATKCFRGILTK